jgi:hypothetical protein
MRIGFSFLILFLCGDLFSQKASCLSPFLHKGYYGFLNASGDTLVKPVYYNLEKLSDCSYLAGFDGQWFHLNAEGKVSSKDAYKRIYEIQGGKAFVSVQADNKAILIDSTGKNTLPYEFDRPRRIENFYSSVILTWARDSVFGRDLMVFDGKLNPLFRLEAQFIDPFYAPGHKPFFCAKSDSGYRFYDEHGKPMFSHYFSRIYYAEGMPWFRAEKNNMWGVFSLDGTEIIPCIYSSIVESSDSLFCVRSKIFAALLSDTSSLMISDANKIVMQLPYKVADFNQKGIVISREFIFMDGRVENYEERYGYLSWENKTLLPLNYTDLQIMLDIPLLFVQKDESYYLHDFSGKRVCSQPLDSYESIDNTSSFIVYNSKYEQLFFNLEKLALGNTAFDYLTPVSFDENVPPAYFEYTSKRKVGLLNSDGNKLVDALYDEMVYNPDGVFYGIKRRKRKETYFLYDLKKSGLPLLEFHEILEDDGNGNMLVAARAGKRKLIYRVKKDGRIFLQETI